MKTNNRKLNRIELVVVSVLNTETGEVETIDFTSDEEIMKFLDSIGEQEIKELAQESDKDLN